MARDKTRFIPPIGNGIIWSIALTVFAVAVSVIFLAGYIPETKHAECVIEEKDEAASTLETSCGIFQVSTDYGRFIFETEDRLGGLTVGGTYNLTTVGWDYGRIDVHPNIISYEPALEK